MVRFLGCEVGICSGGFLGEAFIVCIFGGEFMVGICGGDLLWGNFLGICCGDLLWGFVVGICGGDLWLGIYGGGFVYVKLCFGFGFL